MSQPGLFDEPQDDSVAIPYNEMVRAKPGDALRDALAECKTEWQRQVITEWARRHPKPISIDNGRRFFFEWVARPMGCLHCKTPSVAIPAEPGKPATTGYLICPVCSLKAMTGSSGGGGD